MPGNHIHRRWTAATGAAAQLLHEGRERPIAMMLDQEANRLDHDAGRARTSHPDGAIRPVRKTVLRRERRRVHRGGSLPFLKEQNKNKNVWSCRCWKH